MKNILITGANSYIGTSFEKWLEREPSKYKVETLNMRDSSWKTQDFSRFDVVFHVAGIAHIKETTENEKLYYEINRDLAYETAKKAKQDGVSQFIFLSSMSVYGLENGLIDNQTKLNPNTAYGKSKIEAEELIKPLEDETFKIAILRPPMVYGKGCKGNYQRLAKLALKTPLFPNIDNKRSMIYIDNLSEFTKKIIDNQSRGLYFPQNTEYVNTSDMVSKIAEQHNKKIVLTKLFNPMLKMINISTINKVFGSLVYEKSMSSYQDNYNVVIYEESISKTES